MTHGMSSTSSETVETSRPRVIAADATLFLTTPLHPRSEAHAETVFKRVVRPGTEGWPRERCLAECHAVRESQVTGDEGAGLFIRPAAGPVQRQGALLTVAVLRIGDMTAADIAASPNLQIIARNGTGYDSIDVAACRKRGIAVTNMPGGNAAAVGELTVTLALTVLRRVVEMNNRIRSGEQVPSINALSPGLRGKTVGLIGMGDIAYEAAKLFAAFSCKLMVFSPTSPTSRWTDPQADGGRYPIPVAHTRVGSLDELLATADVVSLHCPLTEKTHNLIGREQMAKMTKGAVIINASRGGMVDEDALADALESGHLGGAGLDVMATEPAFGENLGRLRDLPNTVILPHLGGSTDEVTEKGCTNAIDIVVDYLAGQPARNRVA